MTWELFTAAPTARMGRKPKHRLGYIKDGRLTIGRDLVKLGFDPSVPYGLMYDRERCVIGLAPNAGTYRVSGKGRQMCLVAFMLKFELIGDFVIDSAYVDEDGIWNLCI